MKVTAFVDGVPAPQGSKSAYVRGGRAIIVEGTSKTGRDKHRAWRQAVTTTLMHQTLLGDGGFPLTGPLSMTIEFMLPRPKSVKDTADWVPKKPDLDKLIRSTLDSVTSSGLWLDDAQVVQLYAEKRYADRTGARIVIDSIA